MSTFLIIIVLLAIISSSITVVQNLKTLVTRTTGFRLRHLSDKQLFFFILGQSAFLLLCSTFIYYYFMLLFLHKKQIFLTSQEDTYYQSVFFIWFVVSVIEIFTSLLTYCYEWLRRKQLLSWRPSSKHNNYLPSKYEKSEALRQYSS